MINVLRTYCLLLTTLLLCGVTLLYAQPRQNAGTDWVCFSNSRSLQTQHTLSPVYHLTVAKEYLKLFSEENKKERDVWQALRTNSHSQKHLTTFDWQGPVNATGAIPGHLTGCMHWFYGSARRHIALRIFTV